MYKYTGDVLAIFRCFLINLPEVFLSLKNISIPEKP